MNRKHRIVVEVTTYQPSSEKDACNLLEQVISHGWSFERQNYARATTDHRFTNLQKLSRPKQFSRVVQPRANMIAARILKKT